MRNILQYIAKIAPYMCMILVVLAKYFQLKENVNTYKLLTNLINILIHRVLLYPHKSPFSYFNLISLSSRVLSNLILHNQPM